jgi:hypothetical protein
MPFHSLPLFERRHAYGSWILPLERGPLHGLGLKIHLLRRACHFLQSTARQCLSLSVGAAAGCSRLAAPGDCHSLRFGLSLPPGVLSRRMASRPSVRPQEASRAPWLANGLSMTSWRLLGAARAALEVIQLRARPAPPRRRVAPS